MNNSHPVFISPDLGRTAEGINALLTRLNLYGKHLATVKNEAESKLVVFGGIDAQHYRFIGEENYLYLDVLRISDPTRNLLLFAIKSRFRLRKASFQPSILIASDLYVGFFTCFLLTKILRVRSRIQISIHGLLTRLDDSKLKAVLRKMFVRFALQQSHSIRVVSTDLQKSTSAEFYISESKFFVSAVPVDIPILQGPKRCGKVIAFIGRMHLERGIDEWVEIVHLLSLRRQDFDLFIIGDGPLLDHFIERLRVLPKTINVHFFGHLGRNDLEKRWGDIRILLSSAPAEGYGLTLREALSTETFVCARKSQGSDLLANQVLKVIEVYKNPEDAVFLLENFLDDVFPGDFSQNFIENLRSANTVSLNALANSWI